MLRELNNEKGYTICILGYAEYDLNPYSSKPSNSMQWVHQISYSKTYSSAKSMPCNEPGGSPSILDSVLRYEEYSDRYRLAQPDLKEYSSNLRTIPPYQSMKSSLNAILHKYTLLRKEEWKWAIIGKTALFVCPNAEFSHEYYIFH